MSTDGQVNHFSLILQALQSSSILFSRLQWQCHHWTWTTIWTTWTRTPRLRLAWSRPLGPTAKSNGNGWLASFAVSHCIQTQNTNHRFPARYKQYTKDDILAAIEEVIKTFLISNTNLKTFSNDIITGKERNVSTASKSEIWGPLKDTLWQGGALLFVHKHDSTNTCF